MWTAQQIQDNRAANLVGLIKRYIRGGLEDAAYECTVRLMRVVQGRDEGSW